MGRSVVPIYIDQDGAWHMDERLGDIAFFKNPAYRGILKKMPRWFLDEEQSRGKIVFKQKGVLGSGKTVAIDIAFPALHGSYGEDGTMQGLFEMFGIPYVGCGVAASALAIDKVFTKLLYRSQNIPTANFTFFTAHEWKNEKERIMRESAALRFPLFVKPARLGSSIGISKVPNEKELEFAVEVALHYDTKVIVEEAVQNMMDITCAVLGNDEPVASLLQESAFESGFFTYEEKYIKSGGAQIGNAAKKIAIPARLDERTTEEIRNAALRIFKLFGCSGIARIDFLYDTHARKWYANEINTIPGTLYHHLWKASGVPFEEVLKRLLACAEKTHRAKNSVTTAFASDILQQAASGKLSLKE